MEGSDSDHEEPGSPTHFAMSTATVSRLARGSVRMTAMQRGVIGAQHANNPLTRKKTSPRGPAPSRLSPTLNKLLSNDSSVIDNLEERKSPGEMEFSAEAGEEEEVFHVSYTADGAN